MWFYSEYDDFDCDLEFVMIDTEGREQPEHTSWCYEITSVGLNCRAFCTLCTVLVYCWILLSQKQGEIRPIIIFTIKGPFSHNLHVDDTSVKWAWSVDNDDN